MTTTDNHRSWAKYYDEVNRRCFGEYYDQLTQQTLREISKLGPQLSIADFGAGTGRLSIPLADLGHEVTAIEPSMAMLEQLEAKNSHGLINTQHASLSSYAGPGGHDLGLAVFTVIAYILTKENLAASFSNAAKAIKPDGSLLIDVPRPILFSDNHVKRSDMTRSVTFTPIGDNRYKYQESTELVTETGPTTYRDNFELRYWTPEEVRTALSVAGLTVAEDWSARFPMAGAEYWLCRRHVIKA